MTINITFSDESAGDALSETVDIGAALNPGTAGTPQDFYIRHDAEVAPITNCAFYITEYAGTSYPGTGVGAAADLIELVEWGDNDQDSTITVDDGSMRICQDHGAFDFAADNTYIFHAGQGLVGSAIVLDQESASIGSPAGDGEIPVSGEAHVQVRISIPSDVSGVASRAVSLVFAFSATS